MKMICLANSYKHQGRCIAGIDQESGRWFRPISALEDGRIPLDSNFIQTQEISTLDILNIPVDIEKKSGHEVENIGYKNLPWQILGKAEVVDLLRYSEDNLLYSDYGKAIPYAYLKSQAPVRTLQLIGTKSFSCRKNSRGRWRAIIADEKYDLVDFDLSITDPIILEKLDRNEYVSPHCLLCLSLGQPWQPDSNTPLLCYRLIAGVVELPPELQLITREMEKLSWSIEQGREYLRVKFGKISRYQLTETEAKQFLSFLRSGGKI
jgi:hypothetical protein